MKKRSSLKTNRCEFFPPVNNKITIPVHRPCCQTNKQKKSTPLINHRKPTFYLLQKNDKYTKKKRELTIARAVMDSLIQRFSSNKWPITIQAQRSATNKFTDTTEAWSDVNKLCWNFAITTPTSDTPIILLLSLYSPNLLANFSLKLSQYLSIQTNNNTNLYHHIHKSSNTSLNIQFT